MDKSVRTIGDLAKRGKEILFDLKEEDIDDWRPAGDMYIEDIVKIVTDDYEMHPTVPRGIRFWLKNGDSVIYVMGD